MAVIRSLPLESLRVVHPDDATRMDALGFADGFERFVFFSHGSALRAEAVAKREGAGGGEPGTEVSDVMPGLHGN
jgi:hypothetical protein